jgi:hypothetical protein
VRNGCGPFFSRGPKVQMLHSTVLSIVYNEFQKLILMNFCIVLMIFI